MKTKIFSKYTRSSASKINDSRNCYQILSATNLQSNSNINNPSNTNLIDNNTYYGFPKRKDESYSQRNLVKNNL
jgi:hypothetical protein